MKVLFVHDRLGAFGGAESNILLTCTELRHKGHNCCLLYGSSTGRGVEAWEDAFQGCWMIPPTNRSLWLRSKIAEAAPDVIYLHTLSELEALETLTSSGVPVVRMVHDHDLYCMRSYKYNYFTRQPCTRAASLFCVFPCLANVARNRSGGFPLLFKRLADKRREIELNKRSARVVVYSEYCKEELLRNGFEASRIHIHVPIRCPDAGEPTSNLGPRNLVLFAGQIIRGKGVDALLRALAGVKCPFEAVILGEGNHRTACETLSRKLGLGSKVRFAGYVPQRELKNYYLDASVFAVSSLWPEPFGMTGPEAMLYGLPVVAFDAGGIREWLVDGDNGFLVAWNDTKAFGARLEQLLRDKGLARQMGLRGREHVRRKYASSAQVGVLEKIFEEVCQASAKRNCEPALGATQSLCNV